MHDLYLLEFVRFTIEGDAAFKLEVNVIVKCMCRFIIYWIYNAAQLHNIQLEYSGKYNNKTVRNANCVCPKRAIPQTVKIL